jgi:hypothetical protein
VVLFDLLHRPILVSGKVEEEILEQAGVAGRKDEAWKGLALAVKRLAGDKVRPAATWLEARKA